MSDKPAALSPEWGAHLSIKSYGNHGERKEVRIQLEPPLRSKDF